MNQYVKEHISDNKTRIPALRGWGRRTRNFKAYLGAVVHACEPGTWEPEARGRKPKNNLRASLVGRPCFQATDSGLRSWDLKGL